MNATQTITAGLYFQWSDKVMLANNTVEVSSGIISGDASEICTVSDDVPDSERMARKIAALFNKGKQRCEICNEQEDELEECPCGKKVCSECTAPVYTDEVCCKTCEAELIEGYSACPAHEFDEPSENDMGDMIAQCKKCGFPKVVEAAQS